MRLDGLADVLAAVDQDAGLELPFDGRTYVVRAPNAARGLRCAAYLGARSIEDPAEREAARAEALAGGSLADLTLGPEALAEMNDLPGPVVHQLAWVALVAWVNGEAAANRYVAALAERRTNTDGGDAQGEASPRPRPSRSGRGTGSASRTRKGSTRATKSRPS